MTPTERGLRLGPLHLPVDEEAESLHVRFLQNVPPKRTFAECVRRFNANAPYSGLLYSVTQDVSLLKPNKNTKPSFYAVTGNFLRKQRKNYNWSPTGIGSEGRGSKVNFQR